MQCGGHRGGECQHQGFTRSHLRACGSSPLGLQLRLRAHLLACHRSLAVGLGSERPSPPSNALRCPGPYTKLPLQPRQPHWASARPWERRERGSGMRLLPSSLLQVMDTAEKRPNSWQSFAPVAGKGEMASPVMASNANKNVI